MNTINLKAHFDGKKILLDEPFNLEPNTKLIVTVLPKHTNEEREEWMRLSIESLERAYDKNEPEYSVNLIKGMKYFKDDDIIHINISDGIETNSVELSPNITAEIDKNGELIGIEILNASTFVRDSILETAQAKLINLPLKQSAE